MISWLIIATFALPGILILLHRFSQPLLLLPLLLQRLFPFLQVQPFSPDRYLAAQNNKEELIEKFKNGMHK
jgi:hypothetical protein